MPANEREAFNNARVQQDEAERTRLEKGAFAAWERGRADGPARNPLLYLRDGKWTIRCNSCNGQYYVAKQGSGEDHWWHMEVDDQISLLAEVDAKREVLLKDENPDVSWLVQWMEDLDVSGESMSKIAALPFYQPATVQRRRHLRAVEASRRASEKQLEAARLAQEEIRRVTQLREAEERRVTQVREEEERRAADKERVEKIELTRAGTVACPSCRIGFLLFDAERTVHWEHQNWEARASFCAQAKLAWYMAQEMGNVCASDEFRIWLGSAISKLTQRREVIWELTRNFRGILFASLTQPFSDEVPDFSGLVSAADDQHEWETAVELWWTSTGRDLPATEFSCKLSAASRLLLVSITVPPVLEAVPIEMHPGMILGEQFGTAAKRTTADRNRCYVNGISEIALATLHHLLAVVPQVQVETIVLNCMVDAIDPATGRDTRECVLSVQVSRDEFEELQLDRVDPVACVRNLNAAVPRTRGEIRPVRPLIEFDKNDTRLVGATDVLSTLDRRPNLMDLTPTEFESLIQNLFDAIGLDTHQTQASRDGGVDCIAYDPRPIFGGKVVIQAKRYKNVVGVSAVRDLWGTVMNEGAGKGILVTTSGYGKASYAFAQGKPLELLEGSHLLHLLKEHTGIEARIIVPDTWIDPLFEA